MAKKINRQPQANNTVRVTAVKPQPINKQAQLDSTPGIFSLRNHLLVIAGILAVTFAYLYPCLQNNFTNWDDPGYVENNPVIKDLSPQGLHDIFTTPIMGNYHPLTILTYAIDYSSSALAPFHYHLQSLLFHLATVLLIYCFVQLLTKRVVASAITALLFGIHPMHVESVAWIAGRKDVVYGFFYIAACIAYLYYHRTGGSRKWLWYAGVLVLFLCSLLSKPLAVILPVTLLVIDLFEGRLFKSRLVTLSTETNAEKWTIYVPIFIEKIPFFLLSIAFGYRSILDQTTFKALGTQGEKFNFIERVGLGAYALVTYLWKTIVPIKLLCFYPYPLKDKGSLPVIYYIYPLIVAILVWLVWKFCRKNKAILFGVLFFIVNIALLLQFIPVGGAILADRYSYIPYLGLFFILGWIVSSFFQEGGDKFKGRIAIGAVVIYAAVIGYLSNERCKVWYDTMTLWRDEIEVEPVRAPNGYNNLGFFYYKKYNGSVDQADRKRYYDSALFLLNRAIELQPEFVNPYISLGELLRTSNQFDAAKRLYYKALTLDNSEQAANAYLGLGIIYSITRKDDSAIYCYNRTLTLKPYYPEAHSNYANFLDMTGKPDAALVQYGMAIQQNPDIVAPYLNRGRALQRMGRCDEAFKDFAKSLELNPDMGEIYYARSFCYAQKGNKTAAIQDVDKARSLGFPGIDNNYYQQLKR